MTTRLAAFVPSPVPLHHVGDQDVVGMRMHQRAEFTRVRRGVFAPTAEWSTLAPWDRYLARVWAFVAVHPGAVMAFESAAALRGLPHFGETRDIHVFDAERARSRRYGDVCVHTSDDGRAVDAASGVLATSLADTAVDVARVLPPAFGLAVCDAAVRRGAVVSDLRDLLAGQRSRRGVARAAWVLDRATAAAESPGESVSRAVMEWCGFEEPELQRVHRYEGFVDRSDFYFPRQRVIGESDGYEKYALGSAAESTRRMIEEKRREDRLRRHEGGFARWDMQGALRVQPLRLALTNAGVPTTRAPASALLATLRAHPRAFPPRARPN